MPHPLCPTTFYVLDNSASMSKRDGAKWDMKLGRSVPCSRWEEMHQKVTHLRRIDSVMQTHSLYFLLNPLGDKPFQWKLGRDLLFLHAKKIHPQSILEPILDAKNRKGHTPLTNALCFIQHIIRHELHTTFGVTEFAGFKVVLLTDGVPDSSGSMFKEVAFLCNHVVSQFVVNLIGTDKKAEHIYKMLDERHDMVDIVERFELEQGTVLRLNPWLKYDYFMHVKRLAGLYTKAFDPINDEEMNYDQIVTLVHKLFPTFRMPELAPGKGMEGRQLFQDQLELSAAFAEPEYALTQKMKGIDIEQLMERIYPLKLCYEQDERADAYKELDNASPFIVIHEVSPEQKAISKKSKAKKGKKSKDSTKGKKEKSKPKAKSKKGSKNKIKR